MNVKNNDIAAFLDDVKNAQMILVGLGEAFDKAAEFEINDMTEGILTEEGIPWMIPFLKETSSEKAYEEKKKDALLKLVKILEGKNYFVISKAQASVIKNTPWREGRLVETFGSTLKKQCEMACEESDVTLISVDETKSLKEAAEEFLRDISNDEDLGEELAILPQEVRTAMKMIGKREKTITAASILKGKVREILGKCDHCGMPMILNTYCRGFGGTEVSRESAADAEVSRESAADAEVSRESAADAEVSRESAADANGSEKKRTGRYDERGYLKDWERYTKWLGGSMNRELLLIELGCDAKTPEIIRGPFEKIAELNLKSKYYRIGSDDEKNVIDWLLKL